MKRSLHALLRHCSAEEGQSMVEYALIISVLILAVIGFFAMSVSRNVGELYQNTLQQLINALS